MKTLNNLGHSVSATAQSVMYVRSDKYAHARVLTVGALLTTVMVLCMSGVAEAGNTLNKYATDTAGKTNSAVDIITYICYIGGAALAALGIVDLKKHVENPGQNPMKNGLAKLGFGGMLLALPFITDVMQDTTGAESTGAGFSKFEQNLSIP